VAIGGPSADATVGGVPIAVVARTMFEQPKGEILSVVDRDVTAVEYE